MREADDCPEINITDIPLFDEHEPRSLINIVWNHLRQPLILLGQGRPELFQISEVSLKKRAEPETIHSMLRMRFWAEYERAQLNGDKMRAQFVLHGTCTREFWSSTVLRDPEKLAFIITPPPRYITRMESMLYMALDEMEEALRIPLIDKGKVNVKLLAEKVKIFQLLDLRVKGAVVQKIAMHSRIEQKTQITQGESLESLPLHNLEAIEAQLSKVKKQIERAQNRELLLPEPRGDVIDVTSEAKAEPNENAPNEASEEASHEEVHFVESQVPTRQIDEG